MPKAKKAAPKKKVGERKSAPTPTAPAVTSTADLFEIETDPPPPARVMSPEKLALLDKVQRTVSAMQVGQAFVIPAEHKNTVELYLRRNYPNNFFTYAQVVGNPKARRVYMMPVQPKKTYKK